jgi:ABC-type sugar transport system substrate-binding protein
VNTPETNPGITVNLNGAGTYERAGILDAAYVALHSDGKAHVVAIDEPDFPASQSYAKSMAKEMKSLCPGCSVDHLPVSIADIGTALPGQVVSYLQQHPDTDWVFSANGSVFTGVPAALKAADIGKDVKFMSSFGDPDDYQRIQAGEQYGDFAFSSPMFGWLLADAMARMGNGQKVDLREDGLIGPGQFVTKDNLKVDSGGFWSPIDYQAQYKKLWDVQG